MCHNNFAKNRKSFWIEVKMFDDLFVNLRKTFQSTTNSDRDRTGESAIAFIQRNNFDLNTSNRSNLIGMFRSYFNRFNQTKLADGNASLMMPRVYAPEDAHNFDWDPIELKAKEKYIEDIDNVIDKFARVVSVTETNSPQRNRLFYVCSFPRPNVLLSVDYNIDFVKFVGPKHSLNISGL